MSNTYKAFVATREESGFSVAMKRLSDAEIGEGDVVIDVEYSTFNYKDGLAVSNAIPIAQVSPLILGIDMSGVVVSSDSRKFAVGDRVLMNGYGASETHNGGFTERLRTKSEYLLKVPEVFTTRDAMIIGTAGYTAMLSVMRLQRAGITPESGEIIVTGASGGVGSVSVMLLAKLGYTVVASTGRMSEEPFLKGLGASRLISRDELSEPGEMMQSTRWAGAVDSCGSHILCNVIAQLNYGGVATSCGLAQGPDLPSNMMPFILRNVSLLGVDSVHAPMALREQAWQQLAELVDIEQLRSLAVDIPFDGLEKAAADILAGQIRGRAVVKISDK